MKGPFRGWGGPFGFGLWCLAWWSAGTLHAQPACERTQVTRPVVVVLSFTELELHQALAHPTAEALSASLASGFALCPQDSPAAATAAARILIQAAADDSVLITVNDEVTNKQLIRKLSLADFTLDSRPLAIAIACDELLRASWLELSLSHLKEKRTDAPPAVQATVARDLERASPAPIVGGSLFLRAATNWYSGGATLFGADLGARKPLTDRVAVTFALGGRRGRWQRSDQGRARLSAASFELTAQYRVLGDDQTNVRAQAGAFGLLAYAAADRAAEDAVARNRAGFASSLRLGLSGQATLAPFLALLWGIDAGVAVRPLLVADSERTLISTQGLELQVTLGLDVGQ